jgi:hypothetical protein
VLYEVDGTCKGVLLRGRASVVHASTPRTDGGSCFYKGAHLKPGICSSSFKRTSDAAESILMSSDAAKLPNVACNQRLYESHDGKRARTRACFKTYVYV